MYEYQISIPHRYDTNTLLGRTDDPNPPERFQFLIGTIQTPNKNLGFIAVVGEFQFLIGTIQTPSEPDEGKYFESEFQFLIGTIQTPSEPDEGKYFESEFQFLIGTIQTPQKVLMDQHMEKVYNIIIHTFENSVNIPYALLHLQKSRKTTCRRSPGIFARLEVDDSCEKFHFPFTMRNIPNPCEFRPPMPTRYKNVK